MLARRVNHWFAPAPDLGGVIDASSTRYSKLLHDNRTAEISTWFTEQSLLRKEPRTALIYIFLEVFGGHISTGPASLWSLQELRALHGKHDALRGATLSPDQTGGNRWAYSQIFQDYKKHFRWDFRSSRYTGPLFNTMDHCRNHAAVRRLTHPVSEFLPLLVSSQSSPLVRSSGNFVFWTTESAGFQPRYGWRQCGLTGFHRFSALFPLSPSPGQKFTVAGNSRNSRHPQTWTHILLILTWIRRPAQMLLLPWCRRVRWSLPLHWVRRARPCYPQVHLRNLLVLWASRVVGDGNGASRPPVAGSAEFPGFALYQSVHLIVSSFFFNGVLFKSRSRGA